MSAAPKRYEQVLRLLEEGCSTTRDIADEMNISVHLASSYVYSLVCAGLARKTGRVIRQEKGKPLTVYEALTHPRGRP